MCTLGVTRFAQPIYLCLLTSNDIWVKETCVKLIVAVIKPFKLEDVRVALTDLGIVGMTVSEVKGFGRQSGHTEIYRGAEYTVQYVPKVRLEIGVTADMVEPAVNAISDAARTGKIGDGKLFVLDIQSALRVRTGETDVDAL